MKVTLGELASQSHRPTQPRMAALPTDLAKQIDATWQRLYPNAAK